MLSKSVRLLQTSESPYDIDPSSTISILVPKSLMTLSEHNFVAVYDCLEIDKARKKQVSPEYYFRAGATGCQFGWGCTKEWREPKLKCYIVCGAYLSCKTVRRGVAYVRY